MRVPYLRLVDRARWAVLVMIYSGSGVPGAVEEQMGQFEKHVFVCTSGTWCPQIDGDGLGVHARLKDQVARAGLKGRVRVNHAGCLNQCGHGPMVVVYPEDVWYGSVQVADVEQIVQHHLIGGRPVERLRYVAPPGDNKIPRPEPE